jgi:hypothetical protein
MKVCLAIALLVCSVVCLAQGPGTSLGNGVFFSPATAPPPPGNSNFDTICTDPSVISCRKLSTLAEFLTNPAGSDVFDLSTFAEGYNWPGGHSGTYQMAFDASQTFEGEGSFKSTAPASYGSDTSGTYMFPFDKGSTTWPHQYGHGSGEIFAQVRVYYAAGYVAECSNPAGIDGQKEFSVVIGPTAAMGSTWQPTTCVDNEKVVNRNQCFPFVKIYHSCGLKDGNYEGLFPSVSGDFLYQNSVGGTYNQANLADYSKFVQYHEGEWMTYTLHVKAGKDYGRVGQTANYRHDSTLELWIARENQPSVLAISIPDYDLVQHDLSSSHLCCGSAAWWIAHNVIAKDGQLIWIPYHTGRLNANTTTNTWWRNVIVSTRRPPDPGVQTPNPPDSMRATAWNSSTGATTYHFRDNSDVAGAVAATSFQVSRCQGEKYSCDYNQSWAVISPTVAPSCSGNDCQFSDTPPSATTTLYSYKVKAVNASGSSAFTNNATNVPGPVYDVTAIAQGSTSIKVYWRQAAPAFQTSTVLERCTGAWNSAACMTGNTFSSSGNWTVVSSSASSPYTDSTVSANTTYTYRVKAITSVGSYQDWGSHYYGREVYQSGQPASAKTPAAGLFAANSWTSLGSTGRLAQSPGGTYSSSANCPDIQSIQGSSGCSAVVRAYSSGAILKEDGSMIIMGGGHQDYGGNELYRGALNSALNSMTMARLQIQGFDYPPTTPVCENSAAVPTSALPADPTACTAGNTANTADNGTHRNARPAARHTFGGFSISDAKSVSNPKACTTAEIQGSVLFMYGGIPFGFTGNGSRDRWMMPLDPQDPEYGVWVRLDGWGTISGIDGGNHGGPGVVTQYDSGTGLFYIWDGEYPNSGQFITQDVCSNTWTGYSGFQASTTGNYGAIDPTDRLFVMFMPQSDGSRKIVHFHLDTHVVTDQTSQYASHSCSLLTATSGTNFAFYYPGADWSPDDAAFLVYPDLGSAIYKVDPVNFTCSVLTMNAGTGITNSQHQGGANTTNGTFGRFRYNKVTKTVTLINDWNLDPMAGCVKQSGTCP